MAFQRSRESDYVFSSLPATSSAWPSTSSSNHQYMSVPSPYDYQAAFEKHSNTSLVSDFVPFEQDTSYSSRTAILGNNGWQAPIQHHQGLLGHRWQPGFWARFPWFGLLALLTATLSTFACIIVLVVSNGVPIDEWKGTFQPTVFLSIGTALANITLTYALYEGVVISFWRKAAKGATLPELHQYWHSGSSLYAAFDGLIHLRGRLVGLACIATVVSILRGPIMQRAASVSNTIVHSKGDLHVYSATELPYGYAGTDSGRTSTPSYMNPNFTEIVQAYTAGDKINGVYSGCDSTCYTSIKGFGFGVQCNMTGIFYNLAPTTGPNGTSLVAPVQVYTADASYIAVYGHGGPNEESTIYNYNQSYAVLLNTTIMANAAAKSNGTLQEHLCALRGGIVSYPIKISNGTITLQSNSWTSDTFIEDRGLLPLPYNAPSNLAGFILAAKALYYGTATYQFGGGAGWILNLNGASSNRYFQRTDPTANYYLLEANITWRDPMEDMINSMREIAFRTSLRIAADNTSYPNASQIVPFTGETPKTIYTSNYAYMTGAVVVSLFGILFVIPTFYGFWELGRPVSLSPLEIAKAFNAPLLTDVHGNRHAQNMLSDVAGMKVRYGDAGSVTLATTHGGDGDLRKLEIGPVTHVRPPAKGARYI